MLASRSRLLALMALLKTNNVIAGLVMLLLMKIFDRLRAYACNAVLHNFVIHVIARSNNSN